MSWGWKIVFVYSAFVVMTLSMVFYFMGHKVDLVADDYYKQEIEYQQQIDKMSNAKSLKEPIGFQFSSAQRTVKLSFPGDHLQKGLNGNIHFYRPSDSSLDRQFEVKPDESGVQLISVGSLNKGLWKIKISWTAAGSSYFDEKVITL
jgi:hypothetical protein